MVTTTEIAPAKALVPFVRCYTYREFNTYGQNIVKPWHASHEMYVPFFFGPVPVKMITQTGKTIYGTKVGSVGMVTKYMGDMTLNGDYSFISIQFRPNGFAKIFKLPCREFVNDILDGPDFLGASVKLIHEQLEAAKSLLARVKLLDKYLLSFLNKQRFVETKDPITSLSNTLVKNPGLINVDQLAYHANMSVRNFERRFNEEIGVSPKLFCRISRFNKALEAKLRNPCKGWTSIAHDLGYFDQMHLSKNAGNLPAAILVLL